MEDIERVTSAQIETVRKKFAKTAVDSDFSPADIARVKNDELWIRRFIAAKDGDVDKASKMLQDTCQWRKEFGVNDLTHKTISQALIKQGTLFVRNKDKWGKAMLIFKAKTHAKGVNDMEDVKKFIVYWFERIERLTKSDQITIIFDMKDTGWSNMDMDFIRYLITLLKEYYPYLVNWLLIYEMPWLLKSAWNIIKTWLDKKEVERIKFVEKKTIKDYIDPDNQLVEWGGSDTYEYSFEEEVIPKVTEPQKPTLKSLSINNNLSSGDDSSPEGKGKRGKVQFTDRDGSVDIHSLDVVERRRPANTEAQRQETVHRVSPSSAGDSSDPPKTDELNRRQPSPPLIETNDVITFTWNGDEYSGDIDIKNITKDIVIFKIKTTAPEAYRVQPTIGLLAAGVEGSVNLIANSPINERQHRFQVLSAIVPASLGVPVPTDSDDGDTDTFPRINAIWKNHIERQVPLYTKRLQCSVNRDVVPEQRTTRGGVATRSNLASRSTLVSMNEEEMRKGLADLERKISANVQKMVDDSFKKMLWAYVVMVVTIFICGILIYFSIPSENFVPGDTTSSASCPIGSSDPSLPDLIPPLSLPSLDEIDAAKKASCCNCS